MTRRLTTLDWDGIEASLDGQGFARIPSILSAEECGSLASLYKDDRRFRSRIDMERFRFGVGEYKYFASPLPDTVHTLRTELYSRLAPTANRWMALLNPRSAKSVDYPPTLDAFLEKCHKAGQR